MELKQWFTGSVLALALAGMAAPAYSDPLGGAAGFIKSSRIPAASSLQQVAYRLCMTQNGARRCRSVDIYGPGVYGYRGPRAARVRAGPPPALIPVPVYGFRAGGPYRPTDPDDYRVGSNSWWRAMNAWDRAGAPQ